METHLTVIGAILVIAGVFVLLAPIASGPRDTVQLAPGTWLDIGIPRTASIAGTAVEVDLSWGTYRCQGFCGPQPYPPLGKPYLEVFDCGSSPCTAGANYSYVGTSPMAFLGSTAFSATVGHHYQVWAFRQGYTNPFSTSWFPVTYGLVEPPLGGWLGVALASVGAAVFVHSIRPFIPPRRRVPR